MAGAPSLPCFRSCLRRLQWFPGSTKRRLYSRPREPTARPCMPSSGVSLLLGGLFLRRFCPGCLPGTFHGGADSPLGTDAINLIPSKNRDTPRAILLAVSRGDKKALGFTTIMRQVREHLIDFQDTTRIVIVLCDQWTKTTLEEHRRDLRAHYRRASVLSFSWPGRRAPSLLLSRSICYPHLDSDKGDVRDHEDSYRELQGHP